MQRRFVDRGRSYDHAAWRALYQNTLTPGVYTGMDLSPSGTVGNQVIVAPGALMLQSGIVVVETEEVAVEIGGTFPPATATDYTIRTTHTEIASALIGGEAMVYSAVVGLQTTQPSDGVILGWIRHPGSSVALTASHCISAPKYASAAVAQEYAARVPIVEVAPNLITTYGAGVLAASGVENPTNPATLAIWRGFLNTTSVIDPATSLTPVATSYYQFPVNARPSEVWLRSIIPVGDSIQITVYDSTGTSVATGTFTPHASFTVDTLAIPRATGSWEAGTKGTIKLVSTVAINTTLKFADLGVTFWPYAFTQF